MILIYEDFIKENKNVFQTGKITKTFIDDLFYLSDFYKESYISGLSDLFHQIIEYILRIQFNNENYIYKIIELSSEINFYKKYSYIWKEYPEFYIDNIYKVRLGYVLEYNKEKINKYSDKPDIFTKDNLTDFEKILEYLKEKTSWKN